MQASISVIIPARNEESRLANCLRAVKTQSTAPIEILLVDGHSTDRTVEMGRSFGAHVLFEDLGTRAGACQVGVEGAKGEYVAFTDADCVPSPTWLENLLVHLSGDIMGVGGRVVNEGETFWQRSIDAALDTLLGSANSVQGRNFRTKRLVSSISGSNSMYRRKDILEVGGFRTDLVTAEDTELNHRLLGRGKLLYVPDAVIHHHHERGLRAFAKRMFQYGYGRGQALLVGVPILLPISVPVVIALAVLFPLLLLPVMGVYVSTLFISSAWVSIKKRQFRFFGALPPVYLIEHACYVAGYWASLLAKLGPSRRAAQANPGNVQ
ncbi:MAG: glycosyltransferase [Bacteroidota bacterium]